VEERYWVELAPGYVRLEHTGRVQGRPSRVWYRPKKGESIVAWLQEHDGPDQVAEFCIEYESYCESDLDEWVYGHRGEDDSVYPGPMSFEDWLAESPWFRVYARGERGMSARSGARMWRWVQSLPWEKLGERPVMITLTYPGEWRRWVADGREFEKHRRAFVERWARSFGVRPVGTWHKEFQPRERRPVRQRWAPHLHLMVGLPETVPAQDYVGFQERTVLGKKLERKLGKYDGRAQTPSIGRAFGGETGTELLRWWSEIATGGQDHWHAKRGVDVRTVFFSDAAKDAANMSRIAAYLAGEASKWAQKTPPQGFGTVGRYYGLLGRCEGFEPSLQMMQVDAAVWSEMAKRLVRREAWRREKRRRSGRMVGEGWKKRRDWQGLTASGIGPEEYFRLLRYCEAAAFRKARTWAA
jgi:hypothetical protein